MDALRPHIYHETQQPGSMMCGQHALNALLQGPIFTAADLSNLAHGLDALEHDIDLDGGGASANVDETGFFSVQVLERALQVWNLSLINWRSAAMRPFHNQPEQEFAFVLNLAQHWLTLRRFGPAPGYWYNLNSFHPEPTFVSRTYLAMFLYEAENEGYTIFTVRPLDTSAPSALPICPADQLASDLLAAHGSGTGAQPPSLDPPPPTAEDAELEAAIRASLVDHPAVPGMDDVLGIAAARHQPAPPVPHATRPGPGQATTSRSASLSMRTDVSDAELAQHVARSRDAGVQFWADPDPGTAAAAAAKEKRRRATAGEEDEEEMVRRAMAASMGDEEAGIVDIGDEDEDMDEAFGEQFDLGPYAPGAQDRGVQNVPVGERVLDDEDMQLQAALRASLEDVPVGGVRVPPQPTAPFSRPRVSTPPPAVPPPEEDAEGEVPPEEDTEGEDGADAEQAAAPEEAAPSLEEMRRARLARFGK